MSKRIGIADTESEVILKKVNSKYIYMYQKNNKCAFSKCMI